MRSSMWPPHARPTSNATSSATPKAAILACPLFSTFSASSKTAPSMHPLETEPAILPERVTSILEPSGRGLEPHVSTTVATAISSPSRVHSLSSLNTSLTAGARSASPSDRQLRGGDRSPAGGGRMPGTHPRPPRARTLTAARDPPSLGGALAPPTDTGPQHLE